MQLVITALGNKSNYFTAKILATISSCHCNVLEFRLSNLEQVTAAYLLVNGNWNQIAKLETTLDNLQKRLEIHIQCLRPKPSQTKPDSIPYSLETISIEPNSFIEEIISFLLEHDIVIEEINASSYQAAYILTPIFSAKFIILIPPKVRLLALREEFLDFCDNLNIDTIIEPIKR